MGMGIKSLLLFAVLSSTPLLFAENNRIEVQKIEGLGIEIEKVAPEKAYGGEELLIQNIETKTGGKVIKGQLPKQEIMPNSQTEDETTTTKTNVNVKPNMNVKVGKPGNVRLKEKEVLYELKRREQLRKVSPYLKDPQFFRTLNQLMKPQKAGTSEARDWLSDTTQETRKEETGVKVGEGELGFTPQGGTGTLKPPTPYANGADSKGDKEKKETTKKEGKGKFLFGYCVVDRNIVVGALEMKARFPCIFNDERIDSGHVWGTLKPMPKAYSLVFKPERIETLSGIYFIREGTALNGSRSSVNVATTVNTRVIEKILGKAGVDTAKSTKSMVEEAWKNQGTNVYTTGTVTIEKKEFNIDLLPYYAMWTAGLSIAEGLMDLFQKETQNMPALFSIHRGARLYVEVYVDEEPIAR